MERSKLEKLAVAMWASTLGVAERRVYKTLLEQVSAGEELIGNELLEPFKRNKLTNELVTKNCELLTEWEKSGINAVALGEQSYPAKLALIQDPPPILFYYGELSSPLLGDSPTMAIIGSRRADLDVCKVAYDFANQARACGICVISGLAYGVDAQAHRGALATEQKASTIAVLGGGLKHLYPRIHISLAQEIVENGGAVISQFMPDESPFPANFLNRNRVIAGLSDLVLVIQAAEKSGSLSTARFALEEGRDVLVCPGAFNDSRFAGSNQLIKQGAYLVTNIDDIMQFYPELQAKQQKKIKEIIQSSKIEMSNDFEKAVWNFLENGSIGRETLIAKLSEVLKDTENMQVKLLKMELAGKIITLPGDLIVKA